MRIWPPILALCLVASSALAGEGFFEDPLPLDAPGGDHNLVSDDHLDVSGETGTGDVVRAVSPDLTGTATAVNFTISGQLDLGAFTSIGTDTTPSVLSTNLLLANAAVTITDFDDGVIGQVIIVVLNTIGDVTFACSGADLVCNGSTDIVATTGDVLTWINHSGTTWHLQSYDKGLINEADLSVSNSPTDNDVMTYNLVGTNFTWVAGKRLLGTLLESQTNNISTSHTGDDILMEKIGEEDFEFNFSNTNRINIRSNTAVNIWDFNALDVQTDGFMTHGLQVIVVPVDGVKNVGSTTRAMHMYFTTNTTGSKLIFAITGGSIEDGDYFCVHDTDASGDLGLRPEASDKIVLPDGTVLAAGNEADAEVTGLPCRFCVLGRDDTLMYIQESEGINWTDGGAP